MTNRQLRIFEKMDVTCRDVERLLGDYVDQELPVSLRQRVDAHLCECKKCQRGLVAYREVVELAGEIKKCETPISDDIRERLRSRLNRELGIELQLS